MQTLHVNLPGQAYPIHIGAGCLESRLPGVAEALGSDLAVVVTNATLADLYPDRVAGALARSSLRVEQCVVPDGEQHKTLGTLATIYDRLMALGVSRKSLIIAFGGGVVGDMAGFAAATFMRGLPLVQVPTTLLAQVDSSVGGKTAVNHPEAKNAIGAFKQPVAVIIDPTFLATLPEREVRAGLFELIKHGIIADRALFEFLNERKKAFAGRDWGFWEEAVARSCAVKARVVEEDEREAGPRAILNFGHSLAHLIETHTGYETYLHGEAVGAGMLFAAYASREWGLLSGEALTRVRNVLEPLARPIRLPPLGEAEFTRLLMHDKKASAGRLRFIALEELGRAVIREGTDPAELWPIFQRFLKEAPEVLQAGTG